MRKRLFALAATALLPAFVLLAYNEVTVRQARTEEVQADVLRASRQAASELERVVDGIDSLLVAISAVPAVTRHDGEACHAVLQSIAGRVAAIRNVIVLGQDGKLACDSLGTKPGMDFSDRSYVRDALASGGLTVGEYTVSRLTGLAVLPVALPVKDDAGTVTGVIATGINLDWLNDRLRERGLLPGGALTVADRNGVILARHPFRERFVGTRIPEAYQTLVHAGAPGVTEVTSQDGTRRILGYQPASEQSYGLYVSTGIASADAFGQINRATLTGALVLGGGIVLAFAATLLVGNAFIRGPMRRIVGTVGRWRAGERSARSGMRAADGDLEAIGHALDDLLDELDRRQEAVEAAEAQRELLSRELGHRVKNTLAVVGAMAQQTFRGRDGASALPVFAQRLSALAGAYDLLQGRLWDETGLRPCVERALAPHGSPGSTRIAIDGPDAPLVAETAVALSLVLHELATNAAKYGALSAPEGQVLLSWTFDPEAMRVHLVWRETGGPAVSAPHAEGFGSRLIRRAFPARAQAEIALDYEACGLVCRLAFLPVLPAQEDVAPSGDLAPSEARVRAA